VGVQAAGQDPSYKRADGLDAAAAVALTGWSSTEVGLWCGLFAAVVIGAPLAGWLWQRRRRRGGPPNAADVPSLS
jgi:Na+/glutamate symporter